MLLFCKMKENRTRNILQKKPDRIVFFDGVCHLCNGFVDLLIRLDQRHSLHFAPLQGTTAKKLLRREYTETLGSVIYLRDGEVYTESTAIILILAELHPIFKVLYLFLPIPEKFRNLFYEFVARNRYKWFGTREFCRIPTKAERGYLLD